MKRIIRNIIWIIIIFILCSIPGNKIPSTSFLSIPHFDKIVHFGLFFILAIFTISVLKRQTTWSNLAINITTLFLVAFYGGLIELLQQNYFVSRSGDFIDFIADFLGGIVAISIYIPLKKQKDLLLNRKPFVRFPFLKKIF